MEDFEKYFGHVRKVFRKILTTKSVVKLKFRITNGEIFRDVLRNIINIFEYYFENFQKKFRKVSRIVMENLEK